MQKLAGESKTFCRFLGDVQELGVALIDYVVVTNELLTTLVLRNYVTSSCEAIAQKSESYTDKAFLDKIDFWYFLVLIVDNFIVIAGIEFSGKKSEGNIVQELGVLKYVLREETPELLENVNE